MTQYSFAIVTRINILWAEYFWARTGRRIEPATTVPFPGLFLRGEGTGKGMSGACNNEGLLLYPWYPLIIMTPLSLTGDGLATKAIQPCQLLPSSFDYKCFLQWATWGCVTRSQGCYLDTTCWVWYTHSSDTAWQIQQLISGGSSSSSEHRASGR